MPFGFFGVGSASAFGHVLAKDFVQRFPAGLENSNDKSAKRKLENAEKELYIRAVKFHQDKRLGFFRKAALLNSVRWGLKEAGFSNAFIQKLTSNVLLQLTRVNSVKG